MRPKYRKKTLYEKIAEFHTRLFCPHELWRSANPFWVGTEDLGYVTCVHCGKRKRIESLNKREHLIHV